MITYSKIGKRGNLGNQFFQIAATIGLATKNSLEVGFLPWQYQAYFKNQLPILHDLPKDITILNEEYYHHHSWDFNAQTTNYDIVGWLQSEKYFDIPKTRFYFEFQDSLVAKLKEKYAEAFKRKTILISIRRGDFVGHPDYQQLSIKYYFSALVRYFPDWESTNLVVLSDDIAYCKFHFSFLKNVYFGDNLNAVEQLCLGSLCDDFIISNSTFSWWSAWLGEKSASKIVRPHKNFDGKKSLECDDKDYFPERWISYNATTDLIPLKEVIIHLNFKNNPKPLRVYLQHYFDVEIRDNSISNEDYKFRYFFHKDYFLPPFLIYYTYLKKKNSMANSVINKTLSIFKVSKRLNYDEFLVQQDFGMFSSIFNFRGSGQKKADKIIYIESAAISKDEHIDEQHSTQILITSPVGQFCNRGGYSFSAKRFIKNSEIALKVNIKKWLRIKKKMKNQLHVAYLVSHYPHVAFGDDGGLGTSVYTLVETIRRKNCYVSVFVYGQEKEFEIREENLTIYSIPDSKATFLKFYFHRKQIERFIRDKIKSTAIDILEAPDWTGITAFMGFDIPLIIRFHGSDAYFCKLENRKQKFKNFFFEKLAVMQANAFIAPTAFAGELSKKIFKINKKEIRIIHYGLEIENFQNSNPEHFDPELILYIGTIIRKKGVFELPGIFQLIKEQYPNSKLVLIGGDSFDIETGASSTWKLVSDMFNKETIGSVLYVGKIPYQEVKKYIKNAHVCIFPTFAETLGMVTIESMALKKPVINSDIGWSKELIEDGISGYLVHPKKHELYAERISQLFKDKEKTITIGAAASVRVEKNFDIEKIVFQNIDFYHEVVNRK